jgi:acetyl esterase/lipase
MPLHPQVDAHLRSIAGLPPVWTIPLEQVRADYITAAPLNVGPLDEVAETEDRLLPGPEGRVPVRIYTPHETASGTLVFFHGGGWVVGNLDTHDVICHALAARTPCRVLAVDYRLAPEYPYPAALVDAWAATAWTLHTASGPVAVGGDSAGGNLAAVVAVRARDRGFPLALQALLYPVTDAAMDTRSYEECADGYRLTRGSMEWYWGHYRGDADPSDPELSPLRASDLSGVAPALVTTAEFDPLRDEGEAYAERLHEAGVPVTLKRYDGLIHGFYTLGAHLDATSRGYDDVAVALRAAFA